MRSALAGAVQVIELKLPAVVRLFVIGVDAVAASDSSRLLSWVTVVAV